MEIAILISVIALAVLAFLNLIFTVTSSGFLVRIADTTAENKAQITETQDMLEQQALFIAEQLKQVQIGNRTISKFILEMHGYAEAPAPTLQEEEA